MEILEQQLREQLGELLQCNEQLCGDQLVLWQQQRQYETHDYLQAMMRLTQAIVDNSERREEVCKKLEAAEHRVQKK